MQRHVHLKILCFEDENLRSGVRPADVTRCILITRWLFITVTAAVRGEYKTHTHTNLLQRLDLLLLPLVQRLALTQQRLPLLLHPHHLVLEPAALVVQVPDGCLLGHLCGLEAADLTCRGTEGAELK